MYPGKHAALHPDKPAVVMIDPLGEQSEVVTYAQLEDRSVRLAHALRDRGLERGDCVAILSENHPRYFDAYWAAMRSGLYVTAINTHLGLDEVLYILRDSGAKALVVSAAKAEIAAGVAAAMPELVVRLALGGAVEGFDDLDDVLATASPVRDEVEPVGQDMLYSSGTTGRPKGIRPPMPSLTIDQPWSTLEAVFGSRFGFDTETVYLSPAPLYHAAPLRYCVMTQATGGTVVVMPKFDAEQALSLIERYAVTHSQWVPTMFVRMLKLPDEVRRRYDVSSMRVAVHAAAPCPVEVKQQMIDWWGPVLEEYYAATEVHGITLITSAEWVTHPGSVGRAGLGVVRICDDEQDEQPELPVGETGLVYFERDELPFVYHNDPVKTAEAQHPRHPTWTTTGDVGRLDDEGFLYLTDRRSFMIISGGANIYPQEVENLLALHPKVDDVAVIGVPDAEMGEQVKGVVLAAPGAVVGPELERELIDYVRERVAHYKAPRSIDFVDSLPRTPTGKLLKREVRAPYLQPAG